MWDPSWMRRQAKPRVEQVDVCSKSNSSDGRKVGVYGQSEVRLRTVSHDNKVFMSDWLG